MGSFPATMCEICKVTPVSVAGNPRQCKFTTYLVIKLMLFAHEGMSCWLGTKEHETLSAKELALHPCFRGCVRMWYGTEQMEARLGLLRGEGTGLARAWEQEPSEQDPQWSR